jgi:site-specific DNA recombinase
MNRALKTKLHTGRVVGYIRVSSQGQVADGESLERQEEKIRAYCSLKGITDVEIIADRGVSGFKSSRPGFQRLISMCASKEASLIIVNDLSRLSRSVRDTLAFVEDVVNKHGVEFVSLQNDIDTTSPMGKAFLAISAVFNQLARDEVSMKVKNMWAHKRSKSEKTGGTIPFGYSLIDSKRLVPLADEQATVKHIHDLRASGHSLRDIVSNLHDRGIKTKTGREKWNPKIVKQILDRQILELAGDSSIDDIEKDIAFAEVGTALSMTDKLIAKKTERKAATV